MQSTEILEIAYDDYIYNFLSQKRYCYRITEYP